MSKPVYILLLVLVVALVVTGAMVDPRHPLHPGTSTKAAAVDPYPYHYFVSYSFATKSGGNGNGQAGVNLSLPIRDMDDVAAIRTYIMTTWKPKESTEPNVVILYWTRFEKRDAKPLRWGQKATNQPISESLSAGHAAGGRTASCRDSRLWWSVPAMSRAQRSQERCPYCGHALKVAPGGKDKP